MVYLGSFALQTRKDFPDPADRSAALHEERYSYSLGERKLTAKQAEKVGTEGFGAQYHASATVESLKNGVVERKVISRFENRHGMLFSEEVYHLLSGAEKLVSKREIQYEFERGGRCKLPVSETDTAYDPQNSANTRVKTMTWAYDAKDNVTSYTEAYPDDPGCDQGLTMRYDPAFCLMTERATANTFGTVREAYTLTGDKKLAAEKRAFDGSALKERTAFEYDGQNRLIREKRFFGEPLDAPAGCRTTEYAYGAYSPEPVQTTISGVLDALGNPAMPANETDAPGTIKRQAVYDWFGRQTAETDPNGHTASVAYDGLGRKVKEINADGTFRSAEYDDTRNRLVSTDELGNRVLLEYTPLGQIEREALLEGAAEIPLRSFAYDHLGRLIVQTAHAADGSVKHRVTLAYDLYGNVVSKVTTDAAGAELARETSVYAPVVEGKYSRMTTTAAGDQNAPPVAAETVRDALGRVVRERAGSSATSYTYDKLGNKLTRTDPNGNSTTWAYDHAGRAVREVNALGKAVQTAYDALGRKVKAIDAKGKDARFTYDSAGRLLIRDAPFDRDARAVTRYFYDPAGNLLLQETLCGAPGGEVWRKTVYTYDSRNRVTDTILFEEDGSERRSRFEYDALGNKLAVYTGMAGDSLEGAAKTSYTYDRFGYVLTMTDPRGNLLAGDDPLRLMERYVYDATGLLTGKTDRNGNRFSYAYDALDRPVSESVQAGDAVEAMTHSHTKTGQKLSDQNATLTVTNQYDANGRLVLQAESDGVSKTYAYDAAGNRTGFTLTRDGTEELSLTYAYDALGRVIEVKRGETVVGVYTYDDNGNRASLSHPESGMETVYAYNDANLVTSLVNRRGETVLSSFAYTYDLDGNQRSKTDKDGKTIHYAYDSMGRLTEEREEHKTISYTYDRFSNRATMKVTGAEPSVTAYAYHPNNWLLEETRREKGATETLYYRYDGNGNQVCREKQRVGPKESRRSWVGFAGPGFREKVAMLEIREYNGFGQMSRVFADGVATTYSYRPDGLRHQKATGESVHVHLWDGQNIVAEVGATGAVTARFLRGVNLIAREQDGAREYYAFDAHGDVAQRVSTPGDVLKSYRYDAFGNEENPEPLDSNPFRYCGEYFDAETGSVYLRARYYCPGNGRFGAEDAARSGLNWYTYCGNNPMAFVDPSGQSFKETWEEMKKAGRQLKENTGKKLQEIKAAILRPIKSMSQNTHDRMTALRERNSERNFTYGQGLSAGGSLFGLGSRSYSGGIYFDARGSIAIEVSEITNVSISDSIPDLGEHLDKVVEKASFKQFLSISVFSTVSNAPEVQNLTDKGYQIGGNFEKGGVDFLIIPDKEHSNFPYSGYSINANLIPGVDVHTGYSKTRIIFDSVFNIYDAETWVHNKIMGW